MPQAKILVVEDERIVAIDICHMLEHSGYSVPMVVSSGREAIASAHAIKPDLVLMDIALPGDMDGIEAAGQIQSSLNIPVVYLTAYSNHPNVDSSRAKGVIGCVVKPFEDSELLAAIRLALEAKT